MDKLLALMQLVGYLLAAIIFGYLSVKASESVIDIPSAFSKGITKFASAIKKITYYICNKGQDTKWGKNTVNNRIGLDTHLERGLQNGVYQSNLIQKADKQNNSASPEGSLNLIPEQEKRYPTNPLYHIVHIISRIKKGINTKRGEPKNTIT